MHMLSMSHYGHVSILIESYRLLKENHILSLSDLPCSKVFISTVE